MKRGVLIIAAAVAILLCAESAALRAQNVRGRELLGLRNS